MSERRRNRRFADREYRKTLNNLERIYSSSELLQRMSYYTEVLDGELVLKICSSFLPEGEEWTGNKNLKEYITKAMPYLEMEARKLNRGWEQ